MATEAMAMFRDIFKECSNFAKKVYTMLQEHEDDLSKGAAKRKHILVPGVSTQADSRKRRKKNREGPKRPLSSYMLFVREERRSIVEKHRTAKFTEIGKMLGQQWAKMSEEEKKKYSDLADQDKERYNRELDTMQQQQQPADPGQPTPQPTAPVPGPATSSQSSPHAHSVGPPAGMDPMHTHVPHHQQFGPPPPDPVGPASHHSHPEHTHHTRVMGPPQPMDAQGDKKDKVGD